MSWICRLGRKVKAVTDVEIHGQIAQRESDDDDDDDDDDDVYDDDVYDDERKTLHR